MEHAEEEDFALANCFGMRKPCKPAIPSLENEEQLPLFSDLGEDVFIPTR